MCKIRTVIMVLLVACSIARALETDDAYDRRTRANQAFNQADENSDRVISTADGDAWKKYAGLDSDKDGHVSYGEFIAKADLPYAKWAGKVKRNIVYKRAGDETLLMDVYEPLKPAEGTAPVFYYIHGGGWSGGDKELTGDIRKLVEALSKRGFLCVSVNYRLVKMWSPKDDVKMHDCVVDCRDGLRFLKKHADELGIDPERVVVFGASAGGHLSQLLAFSGPGDFSGDKSLASFSVTPAAGISWYGPSDFRDKSLFVWDGPEQKFAPDHWSRRIDKSDAFDYATAGPELRKVTEELSPVWWLKKGSPALLHIHGDKDFVIPPEHASHLKKKAEETGADVKVITVKGAGHGWWAKDIDPSREAIIQMTADFAVERSARK